MIGELYEAALNGAAQVEIEYTDGAVLPLPVGDWLALRAGDEGVFDRCVGSTLDVGCGPGRFVAELAARGRSVLGVDVTPAAVAMTIAAGGVAVLADVFDELPGDGQWCTALLMDGNVGIGGDPVALLRRVGRSVVDGGAIVVEVDPPGTASGSRGVRLRTGTTHGEWFAWATLGVDAVPAVADAAGLSVAETWRDSGRWFTTLGPGYRQGRAIPQNA